jgi:hypothetical protein
MVTGCCGVNPERLGRFLRALEASGQRRDFIAKLAIAGAAWP